MAYYAPNYRPAGYRSGGYNIPGGPPPVPSADPALWARFSAVDTNHDGVITVIELQSALINSDMSPFDIDTVKLLMSLFDRDEDGMIGFEEFQCLMRYIKDWHDVFIRFDRDSSGTIDGSELRSAFYQFGYNLKPDLLQLVQMKYATTPDHRGTVPTGISFDRFVRACVVVRRLKDAFQRLDVDNDGLIQINRDQFMSTVLRLS